ncbi:MAG: Short-chain dehydrogenase/reductase sdr [Hydrocarboniphaga sp.]|uniref:SDR family NAD(P)-dependent oxidoreductase n=1 Tax=Hydrocarboniphaga sp. TaxID=2033016 RepID=UPI002625C54D|nr:SDR family NAD(P)-dependent oxidoreductase [Hydrocarboniphaga sp.]MDB5967733.1 Short-chain dehydrogenase/reductase sdr [Hydrocarboniphaga sp.]
MSDAQLFDLAGKVALVTGASSGLGRHFALTLSRAGASVAVAARRADKLAELVAEIESSGNRAVAVAMDVADRASVSAALDSITARLGVVDVLVNNAGVSDTKRPLDYTDADWVSIVGTNLTGAWIVAQETARRMVAASKAGSIVNITSILANRVAGGVGPYCASKAGLKHLTQALALEMAHNGIRVNSLAPGYVATELNREFLESDAGERLRARIPARRFGDYANLDGPLLLLVSKAGAYMTGSEIVVDGGHLCSSL